ncbi:MAG TPA: YDG domain-containing protein, partial [Gaiellaceae bacterium]|nr:YDG domain-containing protein [Gaiellaceae bacterium]
MSRHLRRTTCAAARGTNGIGGLWLLFTMVAALLALLAFAGNAGAATLTGGTATDPWISSELPDYAPGSTVNLLGGSWQPGESVHVYVNDSDGQTWVFNDDVTADASGDIADSFSLPNWFVANYSVTATGASSSVATTSFTDGNLTSVSGTVTDSGTHAAIAGATVTCDTTSGCNNSFSTATDASGNFSFSGGSKLSFSGNGPTTLTLTVSKVGYTSGTITLSNVNNGDSLSGKNIALTPACTPASVATQPGNQSITYGGNATFTAAGAGSPAPSVQWQVNTGGGFSNIAGATNTTLSLTKPSVSASGNQYRAVFSNGCGSAATGNAATLTVAAKALTVTGITAANKVYDGLLGATVNTSSAALNGVVSGDTVTLTTVSATGAFLSKTVATGKTVQVAGLTISGASAGNYSLTQPATTADITSRGLSVSGITAANKVYDGLLGATLNTGAAALNGLVSGDSVTLNAGGASGAFANKNVGTGKTVQVFGLTISGADAGNYSLAQPTTTADITAK